MDIIGIDPGMSGAISFLSEDLKDNIVYDMPTYEITKGKSLRKRIDIPKLISILKSSDWNGFPEHVYIEQVSAQPGNGSAAAFTYGFGCGVIEACVVACGLPFTYVSAMRWKKDMSCPKDKDASRMRASQLLPSMASNWDRKKDDGRAESALIALWGRNQKRNLITKEMG